VATSLLDRIGRVHRRVQELCSSACMVHLAVDHVSVAVSFASTLLTCLATMKDSGKEGQVSTKRPGRRLHR
jgi:hypothetical protein